mgnify:FL=1
MYQIMPKVEHEHEHVSIAASYLCLNGLNISGDGLGSPSDRDDNSRCSSHIYDQL